MNVKSQSELDIAIGGCEISWTIQKIGFMLQDTCELQLAEIDEGAKLFYIFLKILTRHENLQIDNNYKTWKKDVLPEQLRLLLIWNLKHSNECTFYSFI